MPHPSSQPDQPHATNGHPAPLHLDPRTYDRALDCVHCGLCLPACPTYTINGLEADSPRGRIYIIKGLADNRLELSDAALRHLDLCLDCRACETACPSGVVYHELIEESRAKLAPHKPHAPSLTDRLLDTLFYRVFPYPNRLKLTLLPARILQKLRLWSPLTRLASPLLPDKLVKMQQMLPPTGPLWPAPLQKRYTPREARKRTVGFFPGCVGSALYQDTNRHAVELLQHLGCEVLIPDTLQCCGAIHHHGGHPEKALAFAKHNIAALENVDVIVTAIAGCGAMLKEYDHLLRDDPLWAERATHFTRRTKDISELLVELAPPPPTHPLDMTVTYHDACHLAHAQAVTSPPRQLLDLIPGLTVIPLPESELCCGAAGTYNLAQPDMSRQLGERKIRNIQATGATTCVTGNVGCAMQIQSEAARLHVPLHIAHPVDLLHHAYFGPTP